MKKRILALLMALVMLLTLLSGCSDKGKKKSRDKDDSSQTEEEKEDKNDKDDEDDKDDKDDKGDKDDEDADSDEDAGDKDVDSDKDKDDKDDDSEKLFQSGTVAGDTYTNEMLGLGCTLDSDWTVASEEEIAATFGMAKELMEEAETGVELDDADTFTDLYVYKDEGMTNINVQVQTLTALDGLAMGQVGKDELLDEVLPELEEMLSSAYASYGADVTCEKTDVSFLGEDDKGIAMYITAPDMDLELYQKQVYLLKGRYVAIVTCTSVGEDTTDELLELFYKV